jgi:hypothetical protein
VPLDVALEDSQDGSEDGSSAEATDDAETSEKIEVHVHVHRDGENKRKRLAPRAGFKGVLFDWQGHYDRVCRPTPKAQGSRWSRVAKCQSCEETVGLTARQCPRCGALLSRRALAKLLAAIGFGTVAVVFALCAHFLGTSVPESQALKPMREFSDDDYAFQVVEVPVPASPFNYEMKPTLETVTSAARFANQ